MPCANMAEATAEKPRSGAGSGQACPSCGKEVDPLRAGHVAILEGRFLYFCDELCKRQLLSSRPVPVGDAETAEPPPVRSSAESGERAAVRQGGRESVAPSRESP